MITTPWENAIAVVKGRRTSTKACLATTTEEAPEIETKVIVDVVGKRGGINAIWLFTESI
jgi:hypothetical protein